MKEQFINSSLNFIMKYQECDEIKIKRLKYGLEGIYSLIIKLIVVIIIACITNTTKTTLIFLFFYAGIRTFSYGLHAKSNLSCWITTLLIYNGLPFIITNFNLPNLIGYIILGISFISILLWAPADTPKKPLIRKKQRILCKILSIVIVLIYTIIFLACESLIIKNSIIFALIVEIIFINPLIYKLTNTQFNSYKYYKNK